VTFEGRQLRYIIVGFPIHNTLLNLDLQPGIGENLLCLIIFVVTKNKAKTDLEVFSFSGSRFLPTKIFRNTTVVVIDEKKPILKAE